MIPLEQSVVVLLCAGLSERFGAGNKLLAPLAGKPLAAHAAELCAGVPFAAKIAVVPPDENALGELLLGFGFELVVNPRPEAGKDSSLRLGLSEALSRRARGVLVLLGDMPHVEVTHLQALAVTANDEQAAISCVGDTLSPPTLFPTEVARRAIINADRPVRDSLGRPVPVAASPLMLSDYDRPEQFDPEARRR